MRPEEFAKNAIDDLFGEVDPEKYAVAWFEYVSPTGRKRREFVTYGVSAPTLYQAVFGLVDSIRHDHRKIQGSPISGLDKKDCRVAWRMEPHVAEEDDRFIATCRLVWWLIEEDTKQDPFHSVPYAVGA